MPGSPQKLHWPFDWSTGALEMLCDEVEQKQVCPGSVGLKPDSPLGIHQALPVPGLCTQMALIGIVSSGLGLRGAGTHRTLCQGLAVLSASPASSGMRILVTLLLDTLPMLGNVLLLCFFVFFIFGIVGVQLWAGLLRNRCFLDSAFVRCAGPTPGVWLYPPSPP